MQNTPEGVQLIFTREKIGKMSSNEFEKHEKRIHEQLNKLSENIIKIMIIK